MNDPRPIYPPAPGESDPPHYELTQLGHIGNVLVQLDAGDPEHPPALILNNTSQAEHLAALLSPNEPLVVDWSDEIADHVVLRLAYTSDVRRAIAELVHVLVMAQLQRLSMPDEMGSVPVTFAISEGGRIE